MSATVVESSPTASRPLNFPRKWLIPLVLCGLGLAALSIDIPVATFFKAGTYPKFLRELSHNAEFFGHAIGVALLVIAVAVLDPSRRNWIPACLVGAYGGGLTADLLKLLVVRVRPRNFDMAAGTVWDTFGPWLSLTKLTHGDSHSFPSAHTATAFGFATVLAAMYPRGRWLFFGYAALVAAHRVECHAHFISDVCIGAAVGWTMGQVAVALRAWWYQDRLAPRCDLEEARRASEGEPSVQTPSLARRAS